MNRLLDVVARLECAGKSLQDVRRIYFELIDFLFACNADPTAVMEHTLKHVLGEETSAEDIPPPPYLMVTTVRIDLEPQQVQLYRCAHRQTF